MSKDNTVTIICDKNNVFYVANIQASENIVYEPNLVPIGLFKPYFNKEMVELIFKNSKQVTTDVFYKDPSSYSFNVIVASSKDEALKVAEKMCDVEEEEMGWGPEYGVDLITPVYPESLMYNVA